jgi:hypothetical protein
LIAVVDLKTALNYALVKNALCGLVGAVINLRHKISLPKVVSFKKCRFFGCFLKNMAN